MVVDLVFIFLGSIGLDAMARLADSYADIEHTSARVLWHLPGR